MKAQEFNFKKMVSLFSLDFDNSLRLVTLSDEATIQLALGESIASILVVAFVGMTVRSLVEKVGVPSSWLELCS